MSKNKCKVISVFSPDIYATESHISYLALSLARSSYAAYERGEAEKPLRVCMVQVSADWGRADFNVNIHGDTKNKNIEESIYVITRTDGTVLGKKFFASLYESFDVVFIGKWLQGLNPKFIDEEIEIFTPLEITDTLKSRVSTFELIEAFKNEQKKLETYKVSPTSKNLHLVIDSGSMGISDMMDEMVVNSKDYPHVNFINFKRSARMEDVLNGIPEMISPEIQEQCLAVLEK